MKKLFLLLAAFLMAGAVQAMNEGREVLDFNFGWRFHAGDEADAEQSAFDDSGWRTVDVPHDFQLSSRGCRLRQTSGPATTTPEPISAAA